MDKMQQSYKVHLPPNISDAEERGRKKQDIVQSALDALTTHIAVLDRNGQIIAVNHAWRQFAQDNNAISTSVCEGVNYLAVCERAQDEDAQAQAMVVGIRAVIGRHWDEFTLEYPCHSPMVKRWFLARVTPFAGDEPEYIVIAHENITERKQAEEAVRQGEERFRQMAENIQEVFWISDLKMSKILYVSPAYETVWGRTCQSLYEHPESFVEAVHLDDRDYLQDTLGAELPSKIFDIEYRIVRPDYSVRWVWNRAFLIRDEQGKAYQLTGIALDITERKRVQEALIASAKQCQVLSGQLLTIQETERREIARELHDQIGQILFGLSLTLTVGKQLTGEPLTQNQMQADELVQDAILRVRRISLDLRPAILDDLGLLPALIWHFQQFTAQTHVHIDFRHARHMLRFSSKIEIASYRIVQEALTNVARYANVNEARVRLWTRHGWLHVQIEDAGIGFDSDQALVSYTSSGLTGMKERALLLGGRFILKSNLRGGTCILAEFPINAPDAPKGYTP